jgi:hypothetical protein
VGGLSVVFCAAAGPARADTAARIPATVSRKTTRLVTRSPFLASTVTVTAGGGVIKGLCRLSLFTELRWIAFCRNLDFRRPPVAQKHQG